MPEVSNSFGFCIVSGKKLSKHTSRIAAVQVFYQQNITNADFATVYNNFTKFYMNDCDEYIDINKSFFEKLVGHFSKNVDYEKIIKSNLHSTKSFYGIPLINKIIIKAAIAELMFEETDIPVIISEYVKISKLFCDKVDTKFTNAILDKLSKNVERACLITQ